MQRPFFSIIVPEYCGGKFAEKCLCSIQSQRLSPEEYEVIFVDDASTDDSRAAIKKIIESHPNISIRIIEHTENRRAGGGRNTGISAAIGEYLAFLDVDDTFCDGVLSKIKNEITNKGVNPDIIAVDYSLCKNGVIDPSFGYNNSGVPMSGPEYIQTQEIPWVPWCYLYRRQFIMDQKLKFQEKAIFDDKDFVIRATVRAASVIFLPVKLVVYNVWDGQTSTVGSDYKKIHDLFWISERTKSVAEEIHNDEATKRAVLNHHWYSHKENTKKYLWRLPYKEMVEILRKFPVYTPCPYRSLTFAYSNIRVTAAMLSILRPALYALAGSLKIYKKLKNRR